MFRLPPPPPPTEPYEPGLPRRCIGVKKLEKLCAGISAPGVFLAAVRGDWGRSGSIWGTWALDSPWLCRSFALESFFAESPSSASPRQVCE